jgi:hypothetical protein
VRRYLDLADGRPHLKWGNYKDPLAWIYESAWIRHAYKLTAGYLENGGSIVTGYLPSRTSPKVGLSIAAVLRRSAKISASIR